MENRKKEINILLSNEELDEIKKSAMKVGLKPAHFTKMIVLTKIRGETK